MKRFIIILTLSLSIVFTQSTKKKKRGKNKVIKNEISSIIQDASESVPRRISYQGLITKADGSPTEDGSYEILFKLYGSVDGGDPVWSENLEVTVSNGIISTMLGNVNPFTAIPNEAFLELTVDGSTLSPRQSMTSVFYSVLSDTSNYARTADYDELINLPNLDVYVLKDSLESYTTSDALFDTLSSYQKLDSNLTDLVEDGILSASKVEFGITSEGTSGQSWVSDGEGSGEWGIPSAIEADDIIAGDSNINIQTTSGGINIDPEDGSSILLDSTIVISSGSIGTIEDSDLIELSIDTLKVQGTVVANSVSGSAVLDEDNMASDSDIKLASQQSIKAYVDDKLNTGSSLETISDLELADGNFIVADGESWTVESEATARTSLGLGNIATQNLENINIDGGNIDGAEIGLNNPATGNFSNIDVEEAASIANLNISNGEIAIEDESGTISFGDENLVTTGTATVGSGSTIGNLVLEDGSITDSGGNISFGDENLSTTGTLTAGISSFSSATTVGDLTLSDGSITDESGNISFGNENLSTTGTLNAGVSAFESGSEVGDVTIANGSITSGSDAISFGNDALSTTGTLSAGVSSLSSGSNVGNLTLSNGSITDSDGSISFGDENLSTTGTLSAGVSSLSSGSNIGDLTLSNGSITDSDGSISFGDENLSTTGTLSAGVSSLSSGSNIGDLTLSNGSITDSDGSISFGDENLSTTGSITASSFSGDGSNITGVQATSTGVLTGTSPIILEGETDNDFETTISLDDPTADRTITFPNVTGTVITTANDNEIDAVGTVTSGIWQGTEVVDAYVADDLTIVSTGTVLAEQLTTTDDLTVEDEASIDGTMTLSTGSITDLSGSISFGDENLSTSGT
ncbi:MAG: beta strand repeat-containing protein, partial [Candidatus Neomarinimicrobiota bacterium]